MLNPNWPVFTGLHVTSSRRGITIVFSNRTLAQEACARMSTLFSTSTYFPVTFTVMGKYVSMWIHGTSSKKIRDSYIASVVRWLSVVYFPETRVVGTGFVSWVHPLLTDYESPIERYAKLIDLVQRGFGGIYSVCLPNPHDTSKEVVGIVLRYVNFNVVAMSHSPDLLNIGRGHKRYTTVNSDPAFYDPGIVHIGGYEVQGDAAYFHCLNTNRTPCHAQLLQRVGVEVGSVSRGHLHRRSFRVLTVTVEDRSLS